MSTLLDTDVLSELLRPASAPSVLAGFAARPAETLFVGSVAQAEMLLEVRLLPAGRRRGALEEALRAMLDQDFAGRIVSFDSDAAAACVDIVGDRRAAGRPIAQFDAQIAAIARCRRARLATRNVADFEGCGVVIEHPWTTAA